MREDKRDVLEVLKTELTFLEIGGYSQRDSWGPEFIFEDSPTCINCGRTENRIPCTECVLIQFVPREHRTEKIACRHIPLNASGETVDSLYRYAGPQGKVDEAVGNWLRAAIDRLQKERGASSSG